MSTNLSELRYKLLREFARNKAKTAALGVLCLVACYFWLPLVTKMWSKKKTAPAPTAASPTTLVASAVPAPAASDLPEFHWKDFLAWTSEEPRMTLVTAATGSRDPFVIAALPATAEEKIENEPSATALDEPEPVRSPAEYGMVLRNTFVGGRASTANINGVNFRLGSRVPIQAPGSESPAVNELDGFRLLEVHPQYVTLERDGHSFQLELAPPGSDSKILIRPAAQ